MKVKSERGSLSVVSDSSDPMDCSLPGSSIHGILQAKVLEWVAISFSIYVIHIVIFFLSGLPWWLRCKASVYNEGDPGSIPGLGRSPGEENGNPLQYSCLESPMDGGAW